MMVKIIAMKRKITKRERKRRKSGETAMHNTVAHLD